MTEMAAVAISVARNSGSMPSQLIEIMARKYQTPGKAVVGKR
jgi:hypothetical protein